MRLGTLKVRGVKVGRNDPCPCGSGRKFKRCCMEQVRPQGFVKKPIARRVRREDYETLAVQRSSRPIIAAKFKGRRFRAVGSRLYHRPLSETFHEFLWHHLQWTLGEQWYRSEVEKPAEERHQIVQWFFDLLEWQKANSTPEQRALGGWGALPSGDVQALTSLAYDVYSLLHSMALPNDLVERLRDHREFQGARYEVAVAAIFVRGGFDLQFLKTKDTKHCEFLATQKVTQWRVGVEAKSRRRAGVLHEQGRVNLEAVIRGDVQNLFDDALRQKPDGTPFMVFIDLNCPPTEGVSPFGKTWWEGLRQCLDTHDAIKEGKEDKADAFNAVIVTNFSTHYFGEEVAGVIGEKLLVKSFRPRDPLPEEALVAIWEAVNRYGSFPRDPETVGA